MNKKVNKMKKKNNKIKNIKKMIIIEFGNLLKLEKSLYNILN